MQNYLIKELKNKAKKKTNCIYYKRYLIKLPKMEIIEETMPVFHQNPMTYATMSANNINLIKTLKKL